MIRVLLAEDHPQMIRAITQFIERAEDMEVADVLTTFQDVFERVQEIEHEVVLMNDYLSPMTSMSATAQLRELGRSEPILVMCAQRDAEPIRASLAAGAEGFILKEEFTHHLLSAIRAVYGGEHYLSPLALQVLMQEDDDG